VTIINAGHDLYMQSPLIGDLVIDFLKGEDLNFKKIELAPTVSE
jgi:hypothetical protein